MISPKPAALHDDCRKPWGFLVVHGARHRIQARAVRRRTLAESIETIDRVLTVMDFGQAMLLGRSLGATYAVVNWPVEDAAYSNNTIPSFECDSGLWYG